MLSLGLEGLKQDFCSGSIQPSREQVLRTFRRAMTLWNTWGTSIRVNGMARASVGTQTAQYMWGLGTAASSMA